MFSIKEVIIVEGIYDKIKLSGFIDSPIITTNGFSVFKNKELQDSLRSLAEKTGIVILTDSDSAGLKIRAFIKQLIKKGTVLDAFVPEIYGKERRKTTGGKEGILGVEGISEEMILNSLKSSGAEICGTREGKKESPPITKADFYALGLSGGADSCKLRKKLARELSLPSKISSNLLLSTVNRLLTKDELSETVDKIKKL